MSGDAFALYDDRLADGVRRVVDEQIDWAITELRGQTDASRDEEVHEARKRCKRVRALLRLIRDHLGQDVYRRENVAARDAARLLSDVRDAQVLVETLDDARAVADGQLDDDAAGEVREALRSSHRRLRQRVVYRGTATDQAIAMLGEVRERAHRWDLDTLDDDALQAGLHRVYRRGRKRMEKAYDDPTPERFHEWRKRVKYLWHHIELLTPAWAEPLDALASQIHDLSDLLGDEHDRTVLGEEMARRPGLVPDPAVARTLRVELDRQRSDLRVAARPLAERIYAESPTAFSERIIGYRRAGALRSAPA